MKDACKLCQVSQLHKIFKKEYPSNFAPFLRLKNSFDIFYCISMYVKVHDSINYELYIGESDLVGYCKVLHSELDGS